MKKEEPIGKMWSTELTDMAVELLNPEKEDREKRREKRLSIGKKNDS